MVLLGCLPFQADDSLPERGNYLDIETVSLGESSADVGAMLRSLTHVTLSSWLS